LVLVLVLIARGAWLLEERRANFASRREREGPRLAQHKQSSTGRVEEYAVIS
jgi:hypothetical protein